MTSYVYRHIRLDTNEIFYIGIGAGRNFRRAFDRNNRTKFWKNIASKSEVRVEIVIDGISWATACDIEICLIKYYGRKNKGLGTLVNLTDGGDGSLGCIMSDSKKQKLLKINTGRTKAQSEIEKIRTTLNARYSSGEIEGGMKGKKHNAVTKEKMSKAAIGKIVSDSTRQKLSAHNMGNQPSIESRKKLSISNSRLNRAAIIDIKSKYARGVSSRLIGKKYNVSHTTILKIINNQRYKEGIFDYNS